MSDVLGAEDVSLEEILESDKEAEALATEQVDAPPPEDDYLRRYMNECIREADDARRTRWDKNKINMEAYFSRQDWTNKQAGQSREFLSKTATAVEQFSAFVKKGLLQAGDWFSVDVSEMSLLSGTEIVKIIRTFLRNLDTRENSSTNFALVFADAVKSGLLESLLIFKVHGRRIQHDEWVVTADDKVKKAPTLRWKLKIDLIPFEDYYPDPTGQGLYEVHRSEKDLYDVIRWAEAGIYDVAAVDRLKSAMTRPIDEERKPEKSNQDKVEKPAFRKPVVIDEFWGTILDEDGHITHENVLFAVANETEVIRQPIPNPLWHNESPFVVGPLVRVPHSVWHKAVYDEAVLLNFSMNEIFNLILDGGIGSVWGIKTLKSEYLEDPEQVANGIPQGATLSVKAETPQGEDVLEQVGESRVPPEALTVLNLLDREFNQASFTNDLKLGNLPAKQVKATEVVEAQQNQAVTVDSIVVDMEEDIIVKLLRKVWLTILQNTDDLPVEDIVSALGLSTAFKLLRMSPKQRFVTYAGIANFRVHGLSSTLNKNRDFQKLLALMQVIGANPLMLQAFFTRYSPDAILDQILKSLNINPENLALSEAQRKQLGDKLRELMGFAQLATQGGGTPAGTGEGQATVQGQGAPQVPAEVNQQVSNPLAGQR